MSLQRLTECCTQLILGMLLCFKHTLGHFKVSLLQECCHSWVWIREVLLSVRVEFADCVIAYNFLNKRRIWKIQSS